MSRTRSFNQSSPSSMPQGQRAKRTECQLLINGAEPQSANSSSSSSSTTMVAEVAKERASMFKLSKLTNNQSTLSFSRTHFQQLAEENAEIAKKGKYLNNRGVIVDISQSLDHSIKNSKHYHHTEQIKPPATIPADGISRDGKTYVCYGLCIKAAIKLNLHGKQHVGVLNSAHATKPGEKFLSGCLSHESCICRGSLLWPCLTQFEKKRNSIYTINRTTEEYKMSPSSCAIYSPHVPIIRKDALQADMLDEYVKASFVSIPPPNAFELADDEVVRTKLREHLHRALAIFATHGCVDLVLCAYGCGTRGNDPKMVAEVYNELLSSNEFKGHFNRIIFAINPRKEDEYKAFCSVFET